jgi:hypothetical protein
VEVIEGMEITRESESESESESKMKMKNQAQETGGRRFSRNRKRNVTFVAIVDLA